MEEGPGVHNGPFLNPLGFEWKPVTYTVPQLEKAIRAIDDCISEKDADDKTVGLLDARKRIQRRIDENDLTGYALRVVDPNDANALPTLTTHMEESKPSTSKAAEQASSE